MRIARVGVPLLVLIGVVICSGTSTKADSVTITLGNNPQQDEKNILLNSGASGNPVY